MMPLILILLTPSGLISAQTMPGEEDPVQEPATVNESETYDNFTADIVIVYDMPTIENASAVENAAAVNQQIEDIFASMDLLQAQNDQLASVYDNKSAHETIARNNITISELWAELDEISPPIPVKEIQSEEKANIDAARDKLTESDLPILGDWIDPPTGKLLIEVNVDVAKPNVIEKITNITGDIPLIIHYTKPTATFQNCDSETGLCNPIVGGSEGEDQHNGLPCTVSIAAVRNVFWWTENGIIIPDHCNPNNSDYYQADNDESSHLVGPETKDGGWYCDCDFVKSNSRSIDTSKIYTGSSMIELSGKSDFEINSWVRLYGSTSGMDIGKIVAVDVKKTFSGNEFHHLYKIRYISFTDGDSGAPILNSGKSLYGGMNIGSDVVENVSYNYGHEWSFLKSKLGLQN